MKNIKKLRRLFTWTTLYVILSFGIAGTHRDVWILSNHASSELTSLKS
jgi:hypothetical protein